MVDLKAVDITSTWGERFLMNLMSYALILVPMAFIVIVARYRLCPASLQNSLIVQWFVYGYDPSKINQRNLNSDLPEDSERLVEDNNRNGMRKTGASRDMRGSVKNKTLKFLWCFVGLQVSYLIWGLLQEKIMTTKYLPNTQPIYTGDNISKALESTNFSSGLSHPESPKLNNSDRNNVDEPSVITFHDSQFLVFINRIIGFVLSIVALVYNRPKQSPLHLSPVKPMSTEKPPAPLYEYVYCSLSNILSSWCQYEALKYVNFPTQVLSKSCKIVPVMLMSRLMLKKKYQLLDYLCAFILSTGMFIFLLNQTGSIKTTDQTDNTSSISNTGHYEGEVKRDARLSDDAIRSSAMISGLFILGLYLVFDSFTSNWQQSLFSRYGISNWQMMAATNFYSILLTLTSLSQLGTLKPAFKLLASSTTLLTDCLLMSIMSSIGQLFVFYTIKQFGPVLFTVIMTLRQFIAILLSCATYGHRLTMGSTAGILIIFSVVGYQMWRKSKESRKNNADNPEELSNQTRMQFKALK